jgi:hypothetical protein
MRSHRTVRPFLLPSDLYHDARVQMAPSPVFPLPFTSLSRQATILIVLFPQIVAVSSVFLTVIHMVVSAVPIVVPPMMVMVVVGLYGRDRDQQGSTQQECTQVTFHRVTLLIIRTSFEANRHIVCSLFKSAHSLDLLKVACHPSPEHPDFKIDAAFIFNHITDLDGIAANLTILDIRLAAHRCIQYH